MQIVQRIFDAIDGRLPELQQSFIAESQKQENIDAAALTRILRPFLCSSPSSTTSTSNDANGNEEYEESIQNLFGAMDADGTTSLTFEQFMASITDLSLSVRRLDSHLALDMSTSWSQSPRTKLAAEFEGGGGAIPSPPLPPIPVPALTLPESSRVDFHSLLYDPVRKWVLGATKVSIFAWDAASGREEIHYRSATAAATATTEGHTTEGSMTALLLGNNDDFYMGNARGRIALFSLSSSALKHMLIDEGSSSAPVVSMSTCHLGMLVLLGDGAVMLFNDGSCLLKQMLGSIFIRPCADAYALMSLTRNGTLTYWNVVEEFEDSSSKKADTWISFGTSWTEDVWRDKPMVEMMYSSALSLVVVVCHDTVWVLTAPPESSSFRILHKITHPRAPNRTFTAAAMDPTGTTVILGDSAGTIYRALLATIQSTFGHPLAAHVGSVQRLLFVPAFDLIVSGGSDGAVVFISSRHTDRLVVLRSSSALDRDTLDGSPDPDMESFHTQHFTAVRRHNVDIFDGTDNNSSFKAKKFVTASANVEEHGGVEFTVTHDNPILDPANARREREKQIRNLLDQQSGKDPALLPDWVREGAGGDLLPMIMTTASMNGSPTALAKYRPNTKHNSLPPLHRTTPQQQSAATKMLHTLLPSDLIELRKASKLRLRAQQGGMRNLRDVRKYEHGSHVPRGTILSSTFLVKSIPLQNDLSDGRWSRTLTPARDFR
eukprot:PhF_6_TR24789/c0_g1_i4/m.34079